MKTMALTSFGPVFLLSLAAALSGCGQKRTASGPKPEQVQYEKGMAQLRSGDAAGAHASFEMAIRLNPAYAPAYMAQANLEARTGHLPEAIQDIEALHRAAPNTPHVLCRLAQLHAATGHYVEGLNAAKTAMQAEPDCPVAKTEYALSLAGAGKNSDAIALLTSVHRLSPQDEYVTLILAQLLARSGKPDEAWKLLDALPTPSPMPRQSNYVRGWLLAEKGLDGKRDPKRALALLDQVLAATPEDGPANLEKGRILLNMGKARDALTYLQKARDASEPSYDLLAAVAQAQTQLKHPQAVRMSQSARAFSKMVDELYAARQSYLANPTDRNSAVKLARLEAAMGNGQDAQALLTEVLKRNPNDVEALKLMTPGQ